jgi:hypothetical protein
LHAFITVQVQEGSTLQTVLLQNVRAKKFLHQGVYRGRYEKNQNGKIWIIFPEEHSGIPEPLLKHAWEEGLIDAFYEDKSPVFAE